MPSSPHIYHSASLSQLQDFICAVDGVIEDSPDTTNARKRGRCLWRWVLKPGLLQQENDHNGWGETLVLHYCTSKVVFARDVSYPCQTYDRIKMNMLVSYIVCNIWNTKSKQREITVICNGGYMQKNYYFRNGLINSMERLSGRKFVHLLQDFLCLHGCLSVCFRPKSVYSIHKFLGFWLCIQTFCVHAKNILAGESIPFSDFSNYQSELHLLLFIRNGSCSNIIQRWDGSYPNTISQMRMLSFFVACIRHDTAIQGMLPFSPPEGHVQLPSMSFICDACLSDSCREFWQSEQ